MERTKDDLDVLVLGGAGVDTIVYVPELPLPDADSRLVQGVLARAGHTGDFVALGLNRLGLKVHHLDVVGDDPEGELVRAFHREHGIALTAPHAPHGTRRAVNLVGPDGRRASLYDGSRGGGHYPEETVAAHAGRARHAHVSITQPAADALPVLRRAGVTVSTDLHDWDGEAAHHLPFALAADLVFLSAAALPADPRPTMRRIAEEGRARVVVVTAGAQGALQLADGTISRIAPAVPPAPVVDSNGAGDAFAAGYLYGWLRGDDAERCGRLGAVAGAHACTVPATVADAVDETTLLRAAEAAH
ncbi:PfkB family carbohydrate kinase [Streptomyces fragilis]|uniref:PfkB family carbohydrate kinase n=1 Tax=Streptomyces fragilis TaxID=67301 RepID=A0ABV2YHX8_9ACTN|nr:PfkB family carbohydrate kinase [Streptomyces fragilis]